MTGRAALLAALGAVAACAADAPRPAPPPPAEPRPLPSASEAPRARESPPPPAPPVAFHLPEARWSTLANGLTLGVVAVRGLPILDARIVLRGGRAAEGDKPGSAEILAKILEASADVAPLGGRLSVEVGDDAWEIRLAVTSDAAEPALAAIGAALRAPKVSPADLERVRKRLVGDASDRLVEDGEAVAEQALRRLLFSAQHPYGRAFARPEELARVGLADVRALLARSGAGAAVTIVLAGDIESETASRIVRDAFGRLPATAAPRPPLPRSTPTAVGRIVIVHRPKAERSQIFLGALGPRPGEPSFAEMELVLRILGQKGTGRLFTSVREADSLVYSIGTEVLELEGAPSVALAVATTQAPKTGKAVAAMLAQVERLGREAPADAEVGAARSVLRGALATRVSRVGDIAAEIARRRRFGLPLDADERRDAMLATVGPTEVREAAARLLGPGRVSVVVAGDADVIAADLGALGKVEIVDPKRP